MMSRKNRKKGISESRMREVNAVGVFLSRLIALLAICLVPLQAFASYTFINHVEAGSSDTFSVTTGNIDMSGADLLVLCVSRYQIGSAGAISDSQMNSYTGLTERCVASDVCTRAYYKQAPSVSSSMNFTVGDGGGGAQYPAILAMGFSGSVSTPADQEAGTTGSGTSLQPGSITPSENNELVAACLSFGATATISIDSGFVDAPYQVNFSAGNHFGVAGSYKIQTSAAAVNPTFSLTGSATVAADQESFKDTPTSNTTAEGYLRRRRN